MIVKTIVWYVNAVLILDRNTQIAVQMLNEISSIEVEIKTEAFLCRKPVKY